MLALLVALILLPSFAPAKDKKVWQDARIVGLEQPGIVVPSGWNSKVEHHYTIETNSQRIKATEMVPASDRRGGPGIGPQTPPRTSFQVGEGVRIAFEEPSKSRTMTTRKPDIYVLDSKRREHTLTIDEIASKEKMDR